jgi:FkbM family methyltransferase
VSFLNKRVKPAFSKLLFCLSVSATPASFFKLIANTRLSGSAASPGGKVDAAITYKLIVGKSKRKLHLRTYAGDLLIFYEIFWKRAYDINLSNAGCIIDIGANVGLSAIFFREQFPNATIIAVEPDTNNYSLLLKNCVEDIEEGKIVPVHAAIYNLDTDLFVERSRYAYNSSVSEKEGKGEHVKGMSIPTLLNNLTLTRVALLKIDIEGAEENLFQSNYEWLSNVETILIEVHSASAELAFLTAICKFGFNVFQQEGKGACRVIGASKVGT